MSQNLIVTFQVSPPTNNTTTTAPNRVTFAADGSPVSSTSAVSNYSTSTRDSNGRLYVFSAPTISRPVGGSGSNTVNYVPPGGNDDANQINLQLAAEASTTGNAFQDAVLYGPETLRQRAVVPVAITIPLDTGNIAKGVDDGVVPEATPPATIYGRRVTREDSGGWPAGRIIEDRSQYGPQGDLARDIIPSSVVTAIVGENPTGSAAWFGRLALSVFLLFLLIYIIKRLIDSRKKKEVVSVKTETFDDVSPVQDEFDANNE